MMFLHRADKVCFLFFNIFLHNALNCSILPLVVCCGGLSYTEHVCFTLHVYMFFTLHESTPKSVHGPKQTPQLPKQTLTDAWARAPRKSEEGKFKGIVDKKVDTANALADGAQAVLDASYEAAGKLLDERKVKMRMWKASAEAQAILKGLESSEEAIDLMAGLMSQLAKKQ